MNPFPILLAAAAAVPPAPISGRGTITLGADTEARWVPFDLTPGNQIRFSMTLDGRTVSAVLDTGVSYSVLSKRYSESARLRIRPGGSARAIGGTVAIGWVATRTLAIGGLTRRGGSLSVAALPAIATGSAQSIDLLVGRDLTGESALDIDYANRRFRLLRSGRLPFTGERAPLSISREHLVYIGEVALSGRRIRPMVVDTGDGSSITLTAAEWQGAAPKGIVTTSAISFGLAGPVVSDVGIVPELRTGTLTARNVEVRIEPAGGFSESIGVAGRIGSGFLQQYRVLLDPAAGHMLLSPNPDAGRMPPRSTSGLLLGLERDRLRVLHVMRGGPSAAAGWREGDRICSVDGIAVTPDYLAQPLANWSAGAPGRVVALGMCDGDTRRLTLRNFY